jgi:DNA replication protein DnaC
LDEFAYEPFDLKATTYLFRVVSARHGQGSIVLTANTGFSHWKTLFPSEAIAVATVDRLVDRATILRFTGESCRNPKEVVGAPLDE